MTKIIYALFTHIFKLMYTLIAQTIQQLDLKLSIFSHVGYLDGETKDNKKLTKHYR